MEAEGKRLNKYISDAGYCSRREADRLIEAGKAEIRRKSRKGEAEKASVKGVPGDRVFHGDTVFVEGHELPKKEPERVYYLYNKPKGVVCTSDRSVAGNIVEAADLPTGITYAGRLDKDSSGLLLLTNDGALIDQIMRASAKHEKEYLCTVDRPITEEFLAAMRSGVKIHLDDDAHLRDHPGGIYVTTRPCHVRQSGERSFTIVLTQGYNRQIRRMCKALGYTVNALVRTRLLFLRLGDLKSGEIRRLKGPEIQRLKEEAESQKDASFKSRREAGSQKDASFKSRREAGSQKDASFKCRREAGSQKNASFKSRRENESQKDASFKSRKEAGSQKDASFKPRKETRAQKDASFKPRKETRAQKDASFKPRRKAGSKKDTSFKSKKKPEI